MHEVQEHAQCFEDGNSLRKELAKRAWRYKGGWVFVVLVARSRVSRRFLRPGGSRRRERPRGSLARSRASRHRQPRRPLHPTPAPRPRAPPPEPRLPVLVSLAQTRELRHQGRAEGGGLTSVGLPYNCVYGGGARIRSRMVHTHLFLNAPICRCLPHLIALPLPCYSIAYHGRGLDVPPLLLGQGLEHIWVALLQPFRAAETNGKRDGTIIRRASRPELCSAKHFTTKFLNQKILSVHASNKPTYRILSVGSSNVCKSQNQPVTSAEDLRRLGCRRRRRAHTWPP